MFSSPSTTTQPKFIEAAPESVSATMACIHCGSPWTQQACHTGSSVTFRCLHCSKVFRRAAVNRAIMATDVEA